MRFSFFFYNIVANTRHGHLNNMFTDNIMNLYASEIIILLRKVKTLDEYNTRKNLYDQLLLLLLLLLLSL